MYSLFSPAHDSGSSDIVLRPGNRAKLARITFIRMFGAPEVRQLWVFATDSAPYELLSIPPPSTPMSPPPPENDGFYLKDQEREDGEKLINSSRSTRWPLGLLIRCWERSWMIEMTRMTKELMISVIRPLPSIVFLGTILCTIRNLLLDSMGWYYLK